MVISSVMSEIAPAMAPVLAVYFITVSIFHNRSHTIKIIQMIVSLSNFGCY